MNFFYFWATIFADMQCNAMKCGCRGVEEMQSRVEQFRGRTAPSLATTTSVPGPPHISSLLLMPVGDEEDQINITYIYVLPGPRESEKSKSRKYMICLPDVVLGGCVLLMIFPKLLEKGCFWPFPGKVFLCGHASPLIRAT